MKHEITIQSAGQRQRLLEWSQRVADCRQSGLSVNRWCEENGIIPKTYYRWQKKVFTAMVEQQRLQLREEKVSAEVHFAELPAAEARGAEPAPAARIRIGETAVELYTGASPEMVRALCEALKQC